MTRSLFFHSFRLDFSFPVGIGCTSKFVPGYPRPPFLRRVRVLGAPRWFQRLRKWSPVISCIITNENERLMASNCICKKLWISIFISGDFIGFDGSTLLKWPLIENNEFDDLKFSVYEKEGLVASSYYIYLYS